MTERVLVTGATGFLGERVCTRLLEDGTIVLAIGRNQQNLSRLEQMGCQTLQLDLTTPFAEELVSTFGGCDSVVHCAALSSTFGRKSWFENANIKATENVCAYAELSGARRQIYISSPSIYFEFSDRNLVREDAPLPNPINYYASTKKAGEEVALSSKVPAIILRPRGIYGLGDKSLLPRLVRVAQKTPLPLMRGGSATIDLTHVDDVVSAVTAALEAPVHAENCAFNISGGEPLKVKDIVESVCARLNIKPKWINVPFPVALKFVGFLEFVCRNLPSYPEPPITSYSLGLFAFQQSLDISRAKEVLGWSPKITFEQGLNEVFMKGAADASDL